MLCMYCRNIQHNMFGIKTDNQKKKKKKDDEKLTIQVML